MSLPVSLVPAAGQASQATSGIRTLGIALEVFKVLGVGALGATLANWDARARRHHSALVRLEYLLNRHLNGLDDAALHVRGTIDSIRRKGLHWGAPETLEIDRAAYSDLANIEVINLVFGYNTSVERVNHDLRNVSHAYEELKNAFLGGRIDQPTLWANCERLAEQTSVLVKAIEAQEEGAKQLLCRIRVQARQDLPWTGRLTVWLVRSRSVSPQALTAERTKLDREIAESRASSQQVIRDQLGVGPTGSDWGPT